MIGRTLTTRVAMLVAGIIVIALLVYSWPAAMALHQSADGMLLLLSLASLLASNICMTGLFCALAAGKQKHATHRLLAGTFLMGQAVKYIPGRIWPLVMQATILHGKSPKTQLVAANLDLAFVNIALVTGCGFALVTATSLTHGHALAAVIVLCTVILSWKLVRSGVASRLIRRLAQVVKKVPPKDDELSQQNRAAGADALPWMFAFSFFYCIGWFMLARATVAGDCWIGAQVAATTALSHIAGVVSLLPGGLGAREGALLLLAPLTSVPTMDMAAFAVISRAALILIDGASALLGYLLLPPPPGRKQ